MLRLAACGLGVPGFLVSFCERIGVREVCGGTRRDLLRRVLNALRFGVCNGCPGSGEPGRAGCACVRPS